MRPEIDLNYIIDAITPENILDVSVIRESIDIFIETLEELSAISIDMKNIFDSSEFEEEFIKTYLGQVYRVLNDLTENDIFWKKNQEFRDAFVPLNPGDPILDMIDLNLINDPKSVLGPEHYMTFHSVMETKGTILSIKYVYQWLIAQYNGTVTPGSFNITEVSPFVLDITGSLPEVLYEFVVARLAEPAGFVYTYTQI